MPLTAKQEAFALAYVETGNAAEAYRRAYDVRAATLHSTIYSAASRLLSDAKISARVAEIQDQAANLTLYTVKSAFEEYEAARQLAFQEANPTAAVSAVNGKVKLFGLEAPARSKHDLTSSDGTMTPKGGIPDDVVAALDAIAGKITGGDGAGKVAGDGEADPDNAAG